MKHESWESKRKNMGDLILAAFFAAPLVVPVVYFKVLICTALVLNGLFSGFFGHYIPIFHHI
ncbi:MAG: hypothetical protein IJ120_09465 [Solobacterium sp.]|nr:hypothetical protein [Solobacterium sp.]